MTVAAATRRTGPYDGNGTTVDFDFDFPVTADSDVAVTITDSNGNETLLTSGYTVARNADQVTSPGGSVTVDTAPETDTTLTITGGTPYSQTTEVPSGGNFRPDLIERALDRMVYMIQQMDEVLDRTLRLPVSSEIDATLPPPSPSKFLSWNASGDELVNSEGTGADEGLRPDLAASSGSSLVSFLQAGTGAVATTLRAWMRARVVSIRDFGAVGNGTTDDTSAIQACATYCYTNGFTMLIPDGLFKITSTINWTGKPSIIGYGARSRIYVTSTSIAAFTFAINTTSVQGWSLRDFCLEGPLTTSTSSIGFKFTGDATSYLQYGYCNVFVYGFGAAVKDEKTAHLTGFGYESMLNWNRWDWTLENQGYAGYWATQGSGTGNQWFGQCVMNGSGVPVLKFEGSGCVVGDIIAAGHWGNQVAGGVGVEIGASTVYRALINLAAVQFDANCDVPLKLSSTGAIEYTNISMQANNYGGNAALGASLQPLRNSIIQDRDVSDWKAGKAFSTNVTGSTTSSIFDIDFASWGAGHFEVVFAGLTGGVGAGTAVGYFSIREGSGSLTVTTISNNQYSGSANTPAITITTSGTKATVKATYNASTGGTTFNATIRGRGDRFKITRL